ncbi:MAG: (Fe-S)-binding protein [Acidiferrobacterales bacterium]|jgi:Fe-S oxidoreductase|nr:(Fe-S)-binding protein [Acidiferrobacterales bacterium]
MTSLENGINAFVEQIDTPIASFFNSCVHCGMCADACLFYTETGDPKYTPIHKLEPMRRVWKRNFTFWGKLAAMLGLSKPVTDAELEEWEPLIYDSCTLCGRCSMVCPVGNDITYMIRKAREGMVAAGHAPDGLKGATVRAVEIGSPMGVTWKTVQAQIKHAEQDTGLTIPVDVENAEYMVLMSSMEVVNFPEYMGAIARIFDQAGVSWTLCSDAIEATNSGIQIGSSDIAAQLVQRIVDGAEKLKVKTVISPECGHAYTAIRWEGANLIGRPYSFKVLHILEVLDELREQGRLQTEGMETAKLTFHDPCQLVRRGGVVEEPRRLLNMVASNFVEMPDAGVWNWCCGGGGGVSANERADELRLKVFSRKKAQLDAVGVETLVTACSNCRIMLEDGAEANNMDLQIVGMAETIAAHLPTKTSTTATEESSS